MFSGREDQMTIQEQIEENGLPNPGESDMPHMGLGGLNGIKLSTVASIGIKAVEGYASSGYAGMASNAVSSFMSSKVKPASTASSAFPSQPAYSQQVRAKDSVSFLDQNQWVIYAGGGVVALLMAYKIMNKKK